MTVITTLKEKRQEKQVKYERKLLREISLKVLRNNIYKHFCQEEDDSLLHPYEECCIELAIESYLLGARYSKFGYYGESLPQVRERCVGEERNLIENLFHLLWSTPDPEVRYKSHQHLYTSCQTFISFWWQEGYEKGERRYRLRLR